MTYFDPMESMLKMAMGLVDGSIDESRQDTFTDETDKGVVIDTVCPIDTGYWETGILKSADDSWVVVEQYDSREAAEEGHKSWFQLMVLNPDRELNDVLLEEAMKAFGGEDGSDEDAAETEGQ